MNAGGNIPEHLASDRSSRMLIQVLRDIPIGFAQVMLQPSHLVGFAFIAGAFWNSWVIASMGIVGCTAGTVTALVLGYPEDERRNGLYGFNGALVGLACAYFYQVTPLLGVFVMVGGAASSIVMYHMLRMGHKPFTFPFVAVTWLIFALLSATGSTGMGSDSVPLHGDIVALDALLRGVGQVLFQDSAITGLIFLAAIAARSRVEGGYAALAVLIGLVGGYVCGFPADAINLGLFGYNGVLCAILFAGPRMRDLVSAVAAMILSILVVRLFHIVDLPAFTFPFVVSSWIILWIRASKTG